MSTSANELQHAMDRPTRDRSRNCYVCETVHTYHQSDHNTIILASILTQPRS